MNKRIRLGNSEAKGRNGYFRAAHAEVMHVGAGDYVVPGGNAAVWIDVFSRRATSGAAPCRLLLGLDDARLLAKTIEEVIAAGCVKESTLLAEAV